MSLFGHSTFLWSKVLFITNSRLACGSQTCHLSDLPLLNNINLWSCTCKRNSSLADPAYVTAIGGGHSNLHVLHLDEYQLATMWLTGAFRLLAIPSLNMAGLRLPFWAVWFFSFLYSYQLILSQSDVTSKLNNSGLDISRYWRLLSLCQGVDWTVTLHLFWFYFSRNTVEI